MDNLSIWERETLWSKGPLRLCRNEEGNGYYCLVCYGDKWIRQDGLKGKKEVLDFLSDYIMLDSSDLEIINKL